MTWILPFSWIMFHNCLLYSRKLRRMKREGLIPMITTALVLLLLLLPDSLLAEPRARTVNFSCGSQPEHNTTLFVPNFVSTMENISVQMRTLGFGVAAMGTEPDRSYAFAQCYGDLSLADCTWCYAEARTILPQCYPFNGGRIYLDGCFMRVENYTFYHEYTGPNDHAVCGNTTRHDLEFRASARQSLSRAVSDAPNNNGYARAQLAVGRGKNDSVYVLADCWKTISANACRACLESASASITGCLPSSEGRALYTGCFMRYSDTNFLNPIPRNGNSRGKRKYSDSTSFNFLLYIY